VINVIDAIEGEEDKVEDAVAQVEFPGIGTTNCRLRIFRSDNLCKSQRVVNPDIVGAYLQKVLCGATAADSDIQQLAIFDEGVESLKDYCFGFMDEA
jgi:hypothetical protein